MTSLTSGEDIKITAQKISDDFKENMFAAEANYKNKYIYVTGKIKDIGTAYFSDKPRIELEVSIGRTVGFEFSKDVIPEIIPLRLGHTIQAYCLLLMGNESGNVTLSCKSVKIITN
jgi:hypothetical protein